MQQQPSIAHKLDDEMPGFGDYERKTDRTIPVIALTRAG